MKMEYVDGTIKVQVNSGTTFQRIKIVLDIPCNERYQERVRTIIAELVAIAADDRDQNESNTGRNNPA